MYFETKMKVRTKGAVNYMPPEGLRFPQHNFLRYFLHGWLFCWILPLYNGNPERFVSSDVYQPTFEENSPYPKTDSNNKVKTSLKESGLI